MSKIYVFSGPCGCGKSTLARAYARHLVDEGQARQVYVIHGDDFHAGFVETRERVGSACPGFLYWPDILAFNWECILSVARQALKRGLDVIIDYVVEEERPLLETLAHEFRAELYAVVLTASQEALRQRLMQRGNPELIDRSLFLKNKLEVTPENQGFLFDNTACTAEETVALLNMERHRVL